jgi:pyruvate-ferredoxin/flavodoxin oxidoreductase
VDALLGADQTTEAGIEAQRERVAVLRSRLAGAAHPTSAISDLLALADTLVKKSVWIFGGDGWAYDIGFGGLDHVLASGHNVNVLVLDTEVYSNTGGQMSKATPRGAVSKFAAGGKRAPKKDLALMAMSYGNVYVARIAMGAGDAHALKAIREAEAYPGPSLLIAYSHCVAHGYDMAHGCEQQKAAVQSGHWPLLRYNPELALAGKNPLQLDSGPPTIPLKKYVYNETRYTMLVQGDPQAAAALLAEAENEVKTRRKRYEQWAAAPAAGGNGEVPQ